MNAISASSNSVIRAYSSFNNSSQEPKVNERNPFQIVDTIEISSLASERGVWNPPADPPILDDDVNDDGGN
jgi:hypothetical protein